MYFLIVLFQLTITVNAKINEYITNNTFNYTVYHNNTVICSQMAIQLVCSSDMLQENSSY